MSGCLNGRVKLYVDDKCISSIVINKNDSAKDLMHDLSFDQFR